jgi:uncharacterized repeat protein (TIGR02543 family)
MTKEGYTFSAWYEVNDLTTSVTKIATTDTGDKEFIAAWTAD